MSELMLGRQLHIKNQPNLLVKIIFLPSAAFVKKLAFPAVIIRRICRTEELENQDCVSLE